MVKNSATRATVQGKLKKLVDAKVLLRSAFFTGALTETKKFSMLTQEKKCQQLMNAVELTKSNYKQLLKKIQDSTEYILTPPNFKINIHAIKSNKDDSEPLYQGHELMNCSKEKRYLTDHAQYIVKKKFFLSSVMATSLVRMQKSISTRTKVTVFCLMLLAFWTAMPVKI